MESYCELLSDNVEGDFDRWDTHQRFEPEVRGKPERPGDGHDALVLDFR